MTPQEYRGALKAQGVKPPRDEPEHRLQVESAKWLKYNLRPEVRWIGGAAGLRLTPGTRQKAAAAGVLNAGWPDLQFLDEHGPAYCELKAESSLSSAQRGFRDFCWAVGHRWTLCRTVDQVRAAVVGWGMCIPEAGR